MNRRFWKWFSIIMGSLVTVAAIFIYLYTYTGKNIFPDTGKHHAMIRLEDVGPGGDYDSLEGLGKLRTVMEYIESKHIPFHVAVISRRMSLEPDGSWKERGIDDPNPDFIVKSFIKILQDAEKNGGILGMHGYSHQYGDSQVEGDNQNSGTGAEFNVKGAPETKEISYAAERITNSIAAFDKAGLHPAFWESPHYKDTRAQEKVFRSYIGILYQPDLYSLRSLKDLNVYQNVNTFGQSSLGSVYVPAPLSYVTDEKSVDKIISKAANSKGLASLYLHPFLEFPYLEVENGADGKPVMKDGLPVYKYKKNGTPSYLHQLVAGFKQEGYHWMSLFDIVPFTPANRVNLPLGTTAKQILLGNVTGHGHADVVVQEKHRIIVIPGTYTGPRNRPQNAAQVWLKYSFKPEEQLVLADLNNDGKQDLVSYNKKSGGLMVFWAGKEQFLDPVSLGEIPAELDSLKLDTSGIGFKDKRNSQIVLCHYVNKTLLVNKYFVPEVSNVFVGKFLDTGQDDILSVSKEHRISVMTLDGKSEEIEGIQLTSDNQLLVGDTNGDGKSDLIVYNKGTGVWKEYENNGNGKFHLLDNDFGPWAQGKGRMGMAADFDGNGKTDIGSYDETGHVLDIAMSFRGQEP